MNATGMAFDPKDSLCSSLMTALSTASAEWHAEHLR